MPRSPALVPRSPALVPRSPALVTQSPALVPQSVALHGGQVCRRRCHLAAVWSPPSFTPIMILDYFNNCFEKEFFERGEVPFQRTAS